MEKHEELRPKRSAVKKVLTYNINYHQIGYSEQRELQRALKNSLIEVTKSSSPLSSDDQSNELLKSDQITDLRDSNELCDIIKDLKEENVQQTKCHTNESIDCQTLVVSTNVSNTDHIKVTSKEDIDVIIDEVINQNLLHSDTNENESSSLNTTLSASLNTSINATINTVIERLANESPSKPSSQLVNESLIKKKNASLKRSKLISSSSKKFRLSPTNKFYKRNLCKSPLNKKILCNRKSTTLQTSTTNSGDRASLRSPKHKHKKQNRKRLKSSDENSKGDDLEFNYKDKFKKRLKLESDLHDAVKEFEIKDQQTINESSVTSSLTSKLQCNKKQCKSDKSLCDQLTNVWCNESVTKQDDFRSHTQCTFTHDSIETKLDLPSNDAINHTSNCSQDLKASKRQSSFHADADQSLDDQLRDKLDLDNLINSLIDKLDDSVIATNRPESNHNLDQVSKQVSNDTTLIGSIENQLICSNFSNSSSTFDSTMVNNKTLVSLNSSSTYNHHKDEKTSHNHKSSSTSSASRTNGHHHSNGHADKESQLDSLFSSVISKSKTMIKSSNKSLKQRKSKESNANKKIKTKSMYDFQLEFDESSIKKEPGSDSSYSSSINAAINSVINKLSVEADDDNLFEDDGSMKKKTWTDEQDDAFESSSTNTSVKKRSKNKRPKVFDLQTCIKNELRNKLLLEKSINKLTNKSKSKSSSKSNTTTFTNGDNVESTNGDLKKKSPTKSNGKSHEKNAKTKLISSSNGKMLNEKKASKKIEKNGKTTDIVTMNKKPRTPHLTKTKLNKQANKQMNGNKRKYVKKSLLKKSERLIRNLYKFRQYLRIKRQELLDLDRDDLSSLDLVEKNYLMSCFINSNNFQIDYDIYDPLTINGLMSTKSFSNTNATCLSDELLDNILENFSRDYARVPRNRLNGHRKHNGDLLDEELVSSNEVDNMSTNSDPSYKGSSSVDFESEKSDLSSTTISSSEDSDSDDSLKSSSSFSSSVSSSESTSDSEDSDSSSEESSGEYSSNDSWTSASSRI